MSGKLMVKSNTTVQQIANSHMNHTNWCIKLMQVYVMMQSYIHYCITIISKLKLHFNNSLSDPSFFNSCITIATNYFVCVNVIVNIPIEVWEWISNFIPHIAMDAITCPCWIQGVNHQGKLEYGHYSLLATADILQVSFCPGAMNQLLISRFPWN